MENLKEKNIATIDDEHNGTVLHCLAALNHEEGVEKILQEPYNHSVNVLNDKGDTPLTMALQFGSLECVNKLLDNDAEERHNTIHILKIILMVKKY